MSGDMHRRCNIKPPPPCSCLIPALHGYGLHAVDISFFTCRTRSDSSCRSHLGSVFDQSPAGIQSPPDLSLNLQLHLPAVSYYKEGCSIFIGAATPPVPPKLVERIKAGEFIDMAELLPDRMGTSKSFIADESTKQKSRRRPVSSIIEWVQCFNTYLAVMCRTCPEKVPDLLAYQMLIIEASIVYEGNAWLGYDRRFRQAAAVNPQMQWSN